jgi:LAS superfamily LD-carboxypeptidase LdcB
MLTIAELTGRARTHAHQFSAPRFAAQKLAGDAFLAMREAARQDGIDLLPFSSFRDFDTQLRIWNQKFTGKKPLYDMDGKPRDYSSLSEPEIVDCILNWSAVPGGSRHQWGTEIDVVDGNAMPPGYRPKLLPEEVCAGGIFFPLHQWLDANISTFGFFRPYKRFLGGMYPEPWHLSYAPLSIATVSQVTAGVLADAIADADMAGKALVLARLDEIVERHIRTYVLPEAQ